MLKFCIALLLTQAVLAHEAYYIEWKQPGGSYLANRERLDRCLWSNRRTAGGNAFYFRDPHQGRELLLTYSVASANAVVCLIQPGSPRIREQVRCEVRGDSRFLSLSFQGSRCQGDIWVDLDWTDHGR